MNTAHRVFLGVALAALVALAPRPLHAAGRALTFRGFDGRTLTGLFFEADAPPAPAVVLVPMLGRPKDDWESVGERLAEAGISALAIDLPSTVAPQDPAELIRWHEPISAAVAHLAERTADVRPGAIGIAGASLGANLTVVAAASNPSVRAIALVSPSLDYRGVRIESLFADYGGRPALLMASVRDPYAARTVRTLARDSSARDVRWSSVPAHGTLLLSRDPDLVGALVEWFQRTL